LKEQSDIGLTLNVKRLELRRIHWLLSFYELKEVGLNGSGEDGGDPQFIGTLAVGSPEPLSTSIIYQYINFDS
jgi:hypothetical protein